MRVFVTGATGWVGTHVVDELKAAGHRVSGLARTQQKAQGLRAKGVEPVLGSLDDLRGLQDATRNADAVMHLAFNHDFSKFAENGAQDRRAIEALGEALAGSQKPLFVTSGVALIAPDPSAPDRLATESDETPPDSSSPRQSEQAARALAERGVRVFTVRLSPSVHGIGESHGFVPILIDLARKTGVSAYVGEGQNRWPAVHVSDAARLYRLALEQGSGERVYHAVAEEGIAFRDIAEAIGRKLGLPVEPRAPEHFGWFGGFASADIPASSARTRAALGWEPTGPKLLEDVTSPAYYGK